MGEGLESVRIDARTERRARLTLAVAGLLAMVGGIASFNTILTSPATLLAERFLVALSIGSGLAVSAFAMIRPARDIPLIGAVFAGYLCLHLTLGVVLNIIAPKENLAMPGYLLWFFPLAALNRFLSPPKIGRWLAVAIAVAPVALAVVGLAMLFTFRPPSLSMMPAILITLIVAFISHNLIIAFIADYRIAYERARGEQAAETAAIAAVKASEANLRHILAGASAGLAWLTPDGRFLSGNKALMETFGIRREEELAGSSLISAIHPADRPLLTQLIGDVASGRVSEVTAEFRVLRSQTPRWVVSSLGRLPAATGENANVVLVTQDVTTRRLAEEQLSETQKLFAIAGRAARVGGWSLDLSRRQFRLTSEGLDILELPAGTEPSADQMMALVPLEWQTTVRDALAASTRTGDGFDIEVEHFTARGKRIWVRLIGEARRDRSGKVNRLEGAMQDVSDRKRVEQSLRSSDRRFRQFADALPFIVWSADPAGKVDFTNIALARTTGASAFGTVEDLWRRAIHPDDMDSSTFAWRRAVKAGEPFQQEFRMRGPDGIYRWYLSNSVAVRDEQGNVTRWYGSTSEIHDQKLAKQALRDSEMRFRLLALALVDAVWDWDVEGNRIWYSEDMERHFGVPRELLSRRVDAWVEHVHPDDIEPTLQSVREAVATGAASWVASFRFRSADGNYVQVLDRAFISRDPYGRAIRVVGGMRRIAPDEAEDAA